MQNRMAPWAVGVVLVVAAFLAGRLAEPGPSAAARPASEEGYQYLFLEVGKSYTFQWQGTTHSGTLAEVPHAGWVKVKTPAGGAEAPVMWINLSTVESIRPDGKKK